MLNKSLLQEVKFMKTGIIDEPVNYSQKEDDKLGTNDYAKH